MTFTSPSFEFPSKELQSVFAEALARIVREHRLACDKLTEEQFVKVLKEAIACGDFQRQVTQDGRQGMVYAPYMEQQRLQRRIAKLEEWFAENQEMMPT